MLIVKSSFFVLCSLFIGQSAFANVVQLDRKVAGFVNHSADESVLLISPDGRADWLKGLKIEKTQSYKIANKECTPLSQSTMLMGNGGDGMTLAYPFLVGAEKVCFIDEQAKSIRLLRNIRDQLPRDAFSLVFAGTDSTAFYFLINGRPFPDGTAGYLSLVTVNQKTLAVDVRDLVTDVPGLSGAMLFDGDSIWLTSWMEKNDIYQISTEKLMSLIQKGGTLPFAKLTTLKYKGIEGMSFFMLSNDQSFFYYNEGYDSYSINKKSAAFSPKTAPCPPIAGYQQQWLLLCDGNSVIKW